MTAVQRASFARTVRQYNGAVLPALVTARPQTLTVGELSLVRDRVWWLTEYELYDTWKLHG